MKKKVLSMMCTLAMTATLFMVGETELKAQEVGTTSQSASLTNENESIGYANAQTRGQYLQISYSKVARAGAGVVYAGGTTIAAMDVATVQVSVMLEKCEGEGEPWYFVEGWNKENKNTNIASTSRRIEVEGGCYYRVRSTHSANNDVSSSYTDGIFIPTS